MSTHRPEVNVTGTWAAVTAVAVPRSAPAGTTAREDVTARTATALVTKRFDTIDPFLVVRQVTGALRGNRGGTLCATAQEDVGSGGSDGGLFRGRDVVARGGPANPRRHLVNRCRRQH